MPSPTVSFEIFPPASLPASFKLWETLRRLQVYTPKYLSVTYGAQGGAQDRTRDAALAVMEQTKLPVAAHLTAARASREDVLARAQSFAQAGIRDIVALRGDPDTPGTPFQSAEDGFANSVELVSALSKTGDFNIRVGAYPDSHPDATSMQQNIDWLKAKIDAGASEAITQFFFEPENFLRFRDACADAGITAPITPGILPISNWAKIRGFAQSCGTDIPIWLDQAFDAAKRDEREDLLALSIATELCDALVTEGVEHLHIYTLNTARLTEQLCAALGLAPEVPALRNVA